MAKPRREDPGFVISSVAHAGLLVMVLVGFSRPEQFQDAAEAIPVELSNGHELEGVTVGDKAASPSKPQRKVEKPSEIAERTPVAAPEEAKKDIPAPPSPLLRRPDPGHDEAKDEAKPVQQNVALPPPRPPADSGGQQQKAEQAKAPAAEHAPKPPPEDTAEAVEPKPVPKPKPAAKVEPKREERAETKEVAPRKPAPALEPDKLAKLIERQKPKEVVEPRIEKPKPKPKSGDEAAAPNQVFDPADISKFLSKDKPQRKASSGPELQQVASLGSPTASAARMSPLLWGELDSLLLEQYKRCWTFIGLGGQKRYIPEVRVQFAQDGSLASPPELLNPPSDPNLRALAESALRAVRRCDPLRIPARYQPYYEQWKGRIVRFNPEEMS